MDIKLKLGDKITQITPEHITAWDYVHLANRKHNKLKNLKTWWARHGIEFETSNIPINRKRKGISYSYIDHGFVVREYAEGKYTRLIFLDQDMSIDNMFDYGSFDWQTMKLLKEKDRNDPTTSSLRRSFYRSGYLQVLDLWDREHDTLNRFTINFYDEPRRFLRYAVKSIDRTLEGTRERYLFDREGNTVEFDDKKIDTSYLFQETCVLR